MIALGLPSGRGARRAPRAAAGTRMPAWLALSRALAICWRRILARAAGDSPVLIGVLAVAVVALAAGWTWLLSDVYRDALAARPGGADMAQELRRATTASLHLSWYAVGAGVLLLFVLLSPGSTALRVLVLPRPVSALSLLAGETVPLLVASLGAALLLQGPAVAVHLLDPDRAAAIPALAEAGVLVAGLLAADLAMLALVHAGGAVAPLLGLRGDALRKLSGLLAASALLVAAGSHDVLALFDPSASLLVTQPLAVFDALGGSSLAVAAALGLPLGLAAVALCVLAAVARATMQPGAGAGGPCLLRRPRLAGAPRPVVVGMAELRVLARHPVLLTSALLTLVLAGGAAVALATASAGARQVLLAFAPIVAVSLAGLTAEGAYGRTAPWHHVYRHRPAPAQAWFWPKLAANAGYAAALAALVLGLLAVGGGVPPASFARELAWLGILFPVAILAGVLLPYRDDVPFNAALTSTLAVAGSLGVVLALGKLQPVGGLALQAAAGAAIGAGCLFCARRAGR